MDLEFSDEQEVLRETVRGLAARHADLGVVRAMEDDEKGYPADFWAKLGESGLTGLTIPEKWGGSEMSFLDAVVVYDELGRALSPSPHFVSSVVAGGVLTAAGSDEQRQEWLPKIASGEAVVTTGWLEPDRGFGPKGVALAATPDGDGWLLTGTKRHVPYADSADRVLVLARTGGEPTDVTLFLVDPAADGVTLTAQRTVASDVQHRLDLAGVRVGPDDVVGTVGGGWPVWSDVLHDGVILLAAQAVGGARRVLEITVEYAKTRKQFDKPLGAFQAIAHDLSDAVTAVDGAETLVWEAAWARDTGRGVEKLAPMAKLFACKTYREVSDLAVHVHGGMGFTVECDVQLFFRRAKSLQLNWWDDRYLEELVAAQLLDA
ncbi:acyl-CoA dehydrogenase family protein [Yinghuangia seranimata]|uniref:acyl-CoA dehydrogenase family protein n=1 Tax=Yinghuangia seranimata TaxID=408067 RepID=UPI00248C4FD5|nr:acyl-CoA dehydrogenase family protein [Yinghuangia seranimata]MDI2130339.1 acyl-CoA dehydrogenase family protein [Yinghuangia seranimata]